MNVSESVERKHLRAHGVYGRSRVTSCTCGRSWCSNVDTGEREESKWGLGPEHQRSDEPCTCPLGFKE